jgi:hypothetical protein
MNGASMIEHLASIALTVVPSERAVWPSVLLALVLVPLAWTLARGLGGVGAAAGLAAMSLIGIADVTVLRPGLASSHADWSRVATACVVTDPSWMSAETLLNIALFVPLAFFAVAAFGRSRAAAAGAAAVVLAAGALSAGIEATQAAYGIGACDSSDVVHNVIGAAIGAVLALLVLGRPASGPRWQPTPKPSELAPQHRGSYLG